MSKPVMISVSGIRGIVGEGFTPQLITDFAAAAGTFYGPGDVMVGADSRITGPMVKHAVFSALMSVGCHPVDMGICATPTAQMAVQDSEAVGGIMVTASHNPVEWNALKLLSKAGLFLDPDEGQKIIRTVKDKTYKFAPYDRTGEMKMHEGATDYHVQAVLDLPYLDVAAIRKRKFIVALDCVNGAGGVILPRLLEALGCIIFPIHCEPTGRFAHTPEPVPENLRDLCDYVRSNSADIGFATDPDGDRLAIVDNQGQPLGEEMTVTLAVHFVLGRRPGRVVVNMSTTRAVEDVAESFGAEFIRTPVGEIHVAKRMIESGAVIGGEGNGGVILPELHPGRDAPVAVALTLQHLLESGQTIANLAAQLPQYTIVKEKITIGQTDPDQIIEACMKLYRGKKCNNSDGLKIDFTDAWVHIRKSNTEPIIRVIAEGRSRKAAQALCSQFVDEIRAIHT